MLSAAGRDVSHTVHTHVDKAVRCRKQPKPQSRIAAYHQNAKWLMRSQKPTEARAPSLPKA
jgi:hypothetical protein